MNDGSDLPPARGEDLPPLKADRARTTGHLPPPSQPGPPPTPVPEPPVEILGVVDAPASGDTGPAAGSRRPLVVGALVVTLIAGLLVAVVLAAIGRSSPSTSATNGTSTYVPTASAAGSGGSAQGSADSSQTSTTVVTTTVLDRSTAELAAGWDRQPDKCGQDPVETGDHSATRTYEVTATVHLWSGPTRASSALAVITVPTYGPGGIGCPDGQGPYVTVECQVSSGDTVSGPFGDDAYWLRTTYDGRQGYVPDEWVDTKSDLHKIEPCP